MIGWHHHLSEDVILQCTIDIPLIIPQYFKKLLSSVGIGGDWDSNSCECSVQKAFPGAG